MSAKLGQRAPGFQLFDQEKVLRSLSDFMGNKTVLCFFPGAFTTVCTREMCRFRDSNRTFSDLGATVVGISVNDPFTNQAFAQANDLLFPILSDYNRTTIADYGIRHDDFAGLDGYSVAKRSVFILDDQAIVRYSWVSEDPGMEPDYDEILRQSAELVIKHTTIDR